MNFVGNHAGCLTRWGKISISYLLQSRTEPLALQADEKYHSFIAACLDVLFKAKGKEA